MSERIFLFSSFLLLGILVLLFFAQDEADSINEPLSPKQKDSQIKDPLCWDPSECEQAMSNFGLTVFDYLFRRNFKMGRKKDNQELRKLALNRAYEDFCHPLIKGDWSANKLMHWRVLKCWFVGTDGAIGARYFKKRMENGVIEVFEDKEIGLGLEMKLEEQNNKIVEIKEEIIPIIKFFINSIRDYKYRVAQEILLTAKTCKIKNISSKLEDVVKKHLKVQEEEIIKAQANGKQIIPLALNEKGVEEGCKRIEVLIQELLEHQEKAAAICSHVREQISFSRRVASDDGFMEYTQGILRQVKSDEFVLDLINTITTMVEQNIPVPDSLVLLNAPKVEKNDKVANHEDIAAESATRFSNILAPTILPKNILGYYSPLICPIGKSIGERDLESLMKIDVRAMKPPHRSLKNNLQAAIPMQKLRFDDSSKKYILAIKGKTKLNIVGNIVTQSKAHLIDNLICGPGFSAILSPSTNKAARLSEASKDQLLLFC